jgi:hypothetical protein
MREPVEVTQHDIFRYCQRNGETMEQHMNDEIETTRTYPRTLAEAFPHAPEPAFEATPTWSQITFIASLFFCWGFVTAVILM